MSKTLDRQKKTLVRVKGERWVYDLDRIDGDIAYLFYGGLRHHAVRSSRVRRLCGPCTTVYDLGQNIPRFCEWCDSMPLDKEK